MTSTLSKTVKSDIHCIAARLIRGRQKQAEIIRTSSLKEYKNIRTSTGTESFRSCQRECTTVSLPSAMDYGLVLDLAPIRYDTQQSVDCFNSTRPEMGWDLGGKKQTKSERLCKIWFPRINILHLQPFSRSNTWWLSALLLLAVALCIYRTYSSKQTVHV
jgi:hypothetical protein